MVKIRLKRFGKKHEPHYRVVIMQARTKRDGKAIEEVGYYNPKTSPSTIKLNIERIKYWLSVGAQPTDTVRDMLIREKLLPKYTKKFPEKPKKTEKKEGGDASTGSTEVKKDTPKEKNKGDKTEEKSE